MMDDNDDAKEEATADAESGELRLSLHSEHSKLAWEAIRSSSSEYDKNILALSSAALGLSLTFMKDIVPLKDITHRYSLYASWMLFAASVLAVIFSFQLSIWAHFKHLENIDDYYLYKVKSALSRKNKWSTPLEIFNVASGLLFFAGLACSVYFVIVNLGGRIK
jgi:hypothetical protein